MAGTFNCPTCGAPLDYPGSIETMRCPYCNNSVIVPEELRNHNPSAPAIHAPGGLQQFQVNQVAALARAGKKLDAIKLYRQLTNANLLDAKTAVEAIQAGSPTLVNPTANTENASLTSEQNARVQQLMQSGQKIEAIKLYRQVTGVGLKEAKDAVEGMNPGITPTNAGGNKIKAKIFTIVIGLFFMGLASIFPLVFIPMGIESWQANEIGGAIGSFIGAGVWALVWGSIGLILIFAA